MKKILLLLLCTVTLGLVSCEKQQVIQDTPNRTVIMYIEPNQWIQSPDGANFTSELNVPEIDRLNVDIEGILVYIDHPVNINSYIQLPYVYSGNAYSYEHFNGGIAIDIQRAQYSTQNPVRPVERVRVKIVLIPSADVT